RAAGPSERRAATRRRSARLAGLHRAHVERVLALRPLLELEGDRLALLERAVAVHLDGAEVDEHVRGALTRDEAVALLGVEPLDRSVRHSPLLTYEPAEPVVQ